MCCRSASYRKAARHASHDDADDGMVAGGAFEHRSSIKMFEIPDYRYGGGGGGLGRQEGVGDCGVLARLRSV